jgi:glycosyltransferase involved in cell wall biosynthesis
VDQLLPDDLPFVSVVIPTWDRAGHLRDLLATLVDQDYPAGRFEVVVADDGSTDHTESVVAALAAREVPRIRYVRRAHRGYCAACNAGVSEASGEIVAFLDSDQLVPRSHLSAVVSLLRESPGADGVGGPARDFGGAARTCPSCSLAAADLPGRGRRFVPRLLGGNMAFRRSVLDEVGPFDEDLSGRGDEAEWFHRAADRRFLYDPDLWVWHRKDGMSLGTLFRAAFRDGMALPVYSRKVGAPYRPHPRRIVRYAGHAILRGCTRGWVLALQQTGADVAYVRERIGARG